MFTHIHNIRYFYSDIYSYPPQTVYVNKTNLDWSLYPLYGFLCLSRQMQRHVGGELNYICVIDIQVRTPICLIIYTPLWASHYFSISLVFFPCRLIDEKSFFMAHFFRMRKWKGPLLLCFPTRAKIDNQCTNVARHADRYTGWMQEQNSSRWTQIHKYTIRHHKKAMILTDTPSGIHPLIARRTFDHGGWPLQRNCFRDRER